MAAENGRIGRWVSEIPAAVWILIVTQLISFGLFVQAGVQRLTLLEERNSAQDRVVESLTKRLDTIDTTGTRRAATAETQLYELGQRHNLVAQQLIELERRLREDEQNLARSAARIDALERAAR